MAPLFGRLAQDLYTTLYCASREAQEMLLRMDPARAAAPSV
jgi:hypothetical protein